jgi:hypothetical protein
MKVSNQKLRELSEYIKTIHNKKDGENDINIYFENNDENVLCLMFGKFVVAKGIQDCNKANVYGIKRGRDPEYSKICESFGFESYYINERVTLLEKIYAVIYAIYIIVFKNTKDKILSLHYKKTHIGDLIYDHIIRSSSAFTIKKIETMGQFEFLIEGILWAIHFERLFKKHKPNYYVAGDICYFNGIIVRLAQKHDARVIEFCTGKYVCNLETDVIKDFYPNSHECYNKRISNYIDNNITDGAWEDRANEYISKLFDGIGDWNTKEAYLGKKVVTKKEILESLKIYNNKKNIVIMAHCFSDTPHCGGKFIYSDYYEWLEETFKIVQKLDNVNWIVKPHPCRKHYGEKGVVEALFEKYKSKGMYLMTDEYSAQMVPILADAIITVRGTAGIEYSCCGIPCVNVGYAYYSNFGFNINVKSVNNYKKILSKIHLIHPLSDEQIKMAKKVIYAFSKLCTFSDDSLQKKLNEYYYKFIHDFKDRKNNDDFVDGIIEWGKMNSLMDSELYKFGYSIGDSDEKHSIDSFRKSE